MTFVPVDNTVLVEMRMTEELQNVENTLYFHRNTAWDVTDMNGLGDDMISWWEASIAPLVWAGLQLREVAVTDLTSAIAPAVTRTPAGVLIGELGGDHLPNNVSLAISFRTANRGRSFRGRNYICGLVESQATGSVVDEAVLTAYAAAYNLLPGVVAAVDATWVVVSRFSGMGGSPRKPIPRAAGLHTNVTTAVFTDNVVDSQRNRLPKRGT